MFAYCLNNPTSNSDTAGLFPSPWSKDILPACLSVEDKDEFTLAEYQARYPKFGALTDEIESLDKTIAGIPETIGDFLYDRFSTPEKASNSLGAIAFVLGGLAMSTRAVPQVSAIFEVGA
jgi:hypothetical protein